MVQAPKLVCQQGPFITFGFSQLHIGGKLARFQKLPNPFGGVLPGQKLRGPVIAGGFSVGKVDAVLGAPCGNTADPAAAVVEGWQIRRDL